MRHTTNATHSTPAPALVPAILIVDADLDTRQLYKAVFADIAESLSRQKMARKPWAEPLRRSPR